MWLPILALLTALSISSVSAYFSIVGLTAIFAAAKLPIIILGSTLEFGKIVTTLFVHRHWRDLSTSLKTYLSIAILVLMMITSMGTFGFLSKAHLDQALPSNDNQVQLNILDQKIKTDQDNIAAAKQELAQLDQAVNQMMGRTTDATGAQRAVNIRKNQAKDRQRIANVIDSANKDLLALQQQEAPLKVEQNKIAVEVGPIKYIADLIYGQSDDPNILEKAVRIVILMLVSVFDPLAIVLLLAASSIMLVLRNKMKEEENSSVILETMPTVDTSNIAFVENVAEDLNDTEEELTEEMKAEYEGKIAKLQELLDIKTSINDSLTAALRAKEEEITTLKNNVDSESERITELLNNYDKRVSNYEDLQRDLREMFDAEKIINEQLQKANDELREELDVVNEKFTAYITESSDKISELTEQFLSEQQHNIDLNNALAEKEGKLSDIMVQLNEYDSPKSHADRMFSETPNEVNEDQITDNNDFGNEFPINIGNGKLFVNTETNPHVLYKFIDDYGWIVIDKNTTDSYITDEYVQFLVESIASGEFEFSDLTDREQERITEVLTK